MKLRSLSFALGTSSLVGALSILLPVKSALASFTCGPYLATYSVRSLGSDSGQGVRCVQWISNSSLIWYGEGYWVDSRVRYRHLGQKLGDSIIAADIHGNGEDTSGVFNDLEIVSSGESVPRRVRVTGGWNEEWILQTNGRVDNYTSTLPSVRTCGTNFRTTEGPAFEYRVTDASGQRNGSGIRCYVGGVWYGEGNWDGNTYAHIGAVRTDLSRSRIRAGAFDICEPSKFSICNSFDWGSITFSTDISPIEVRGAWNENWTPFE